MDAQEQLWFESGLFFRVNTRKFSSCTSEKNSSKKCRVKKFRVFTRNFLPEFVENFEFKI